MHACHPTWLGQVRQGNVIIDNDHGHLDTKRARTLGRETKGEVVLVDRLRAALVKFNPALLPEAIDNAVDELTRDRSAMSPAAANREIYRLMKDGDEAGFTEFLQELLDGHADRSEAGIICLCRSGNRSGKAAEVLKRLGFENTWHIAGGIALGGARHHRTAANEAEFEYAI